MTQPPIDVLRVWVGERPPPRRRLSRFFLSRRTVLIDNHNVEPLLRAVAAETGLALKKLYQCYPHDILRADLARYAALYHHGGLYADWSIVPLRPLEDLLGERDGGTAVLFTEGVTSRAFAAGTAKQPIRQRAWARGLLSHAAESRIRVCNRILYAPERHGFIAAVLRAVVARSAVMEVPMRDPYDVIFLTGPDVVTSVYDESGGGGVVLRSEEHSEASFHIDARARSAWRGRMDT